MYRDISSWFLLLSSKILKFLSFHNPQQMAPERNSQMIEGNLPYHESTNPKSTHWSDLGNPKKYKDEIERDARPFEPCYSEQIDDPPIPPLSSRWHICLPSSNLYSANGQRVKILSRKALHMKNETFEGILRIQMPLWGSTGDLWLANSKYRDLAANPPFLEWSIPNHLSR